MKLKKLSSPETLVARVVGYGTFIEQHRSSLKDLGGNSKQTIAELEAGAKTLKALVDKVQKAENDFSALRSELKARYAELDQALADQLGYAREYAKHHKLTVIAEGLKDFGHSHRRGRAAKPDSKPTT